MFFDVTEDDKGVIIFIKSELTLTDYRSIREKFNMIVAKHKNVIVDLSGCEYIDSSGVSELISLNKKVIGNKNTLTIVNININIKHTLEVCSLGSFIKVI